MADPVHCSAGRTDVQGDADRSTGSDGPPRVEFSLTGEEFKLLGAAAGRAGRARGAYAAEADLAAARGRGHRVAGAGPRVRARPQDRRGPQPGSCQAERNRTAFR
jgi:hypothetical protein